MTKSSYLPLAFQVDESSAIRIIISMSHPGLAKNISEQAFGKNLKIIPAAGAGMYYILFNMFRD
jgi:lactate dehydrogenase-like 2-hydroxyacid dehydrogenase